MNFKSITWKNICAYGNNEHTIDFSGDGGLWLVGGESGAGKSTLLNLPKYSLFQKGESNLDAVANRINKNGYIKCVLESDGVEYIIERTYAPNTVELYRDGVKIDTATKKGKEEIIKNEILKNIPVDVIDNIIILSLDNFVSFTKMKNSDKKDIVNNVIDISSIDAAEVKLGDVIKGLVSSFNSYQNEIARLEFGLTTEKTNLDRNIAAKNNITEYLNVDVNDIDSQISECEKTIEELSSANKQLETKKAEHIRIINDGNTKLYQCNTKLGLINKEIALFNSGCCPTCQRVIDINDPDVSKHHQENLDKIQKINGIVGDINNIIATNKEESDKIAAQIQENSNKSYSANSVRGELVTKKQGISAYSNIVKNIEDGEERISNAAAVIEQKKLEQSDVEKKIALLRDKLKYLYGVNGIKKKLYAEVVPILNAEIAKVLNMLNYPYTMDFDDSFDSHIYHMGEEISYTTLSKGEKKKVDICVVCAMIKLIKNKFPELNVLCLDETVSSLDIKSSTNVIKYLKELASELGINILVVSHTTLDENLFDHRIMISKDIDGFSQVEVQ